MRWCIALSTVIVIFLAGGRAHADDAKLARQHFEDGSRLYDLGKFRDAAREYEEAYKYKPDPALLFNIGQAYRAAGDARRRADGVQVVSAAHAGGAESQRGRGAHREAATGRRRAAQDAAAERGAAANGRRRARSRSRSWWRRRRLSTSSLCTRSGGCGPRSAASSSPAASSPSRWRRRHRRTPRRRRTRSA